MKHNWNYTDIHTGERCCAICGDRYTRNNVGVECLGPRTLTFEEAAEMRQAIQLKMIAEFEELFLQRSKK